MSNVDRDALIEVVERARCAHMVSMADYRACVCGAQMDARHQSSAIVDAVLPRIADDLARYVEANRTLPTQSDYIVGQVSGLELAEQVIRSLSQDGGNPDA